MSMVHALVRFVTYLGCVAALVVILNKIRKVGFTGVLGYFLTLYQTARDALYNFIANYTGLSVPDSLRDPISIYLLIGGAWFSLGIQNYKFDKYEYELDREQFLDKMRRSALVAGRSMEQAEQLVTEVEAGLKSYPRYLLRTSKSAALWWLRLYRNLKQSTSSESDVAVNARALLKYWLKILLAICCGAVVMFGLEAAKTWGIR